MIIILYLILVYIYYNIISLYTNEIYRVQMVNSKYYNNILITVYIIIVIFSSHDNLSIYLILQGLITEEAPQYCRASWVFIFFEGDFGVIYLRSMIFCDIVCMGVSSLTIYMLDAKSVASQFTE